MKHDLGHGSIGVRGYAAVQAGRIGLHFVHEFHELSRILNFHELACCAGVGIVRICCCAKNRECVRRAGNFFRKMDL